MNTKIRTTNSYKQISKRLQKHDSAPTFTCQSCGKDFKSKYARKVHKSFCTGSSIDV